ncbi:hypothetical protein GDO78_007606 [Eleutherodactylus coqui]|uniref:Uncharacterized protein n=1 Tax=Eleutherodactylus coqui TaxID=57060 RepID=A0A8J6KCI7_ELECQ|nr:hypothetical protein GDO78_007606 [Eleutherodactylus coqui]
MFNVTKNNISLKLRKVSSCRPRCPIKSSFDNVLSKQSQIRKPCTSCRYSKHLTWILTFYAAVCLPFQLFFNRFVVES